MTAPVPASETSPRPNDAGSGVPAVPSRGRGRWQVGLRTLFLATAAIAVWMTVLINREKIDVLEARIKTMRPLARELVIDDPSRIAVVKLQELWFDENRWELYLPPGRRYRLCVATRQVDFAGFPPAVKSTPIEPGRHRLSLEQQRDNELWRVTVKQDEATRLALQEPKEWDPGSGSTGGGQYADSTQLPADAPAVLFRRRFIQPTDKGQFKTPYGPTEGLLVWIEPVTGPPDPASD